MEALLTDISEISYSVIQTGFDEMQRLCKLPNYQLSKLQESSQITKKSSTV